METAKRHLRPVGPGLRKLLFVVFGLFALLGVNALYLGSVTALEAATGRVYQDWFYLFMFLVHLVLGLAIVVPVIAFGALHMRRTMHRRNRRAVKVGYALFATAILLLVSGIVLMRVEGVIDVRDPLVRNAAYWLHVVAPLAAAWLFVVHRLAGKPIRWRVGGAWAAVAGVSALVMLAIQAQDPREWNVVGNPDGLEYFEPSLARTLTGDFIPAERLMNDAYCRECHADTHEAWSRGVHRFSSFNNPPYLFSVRETRAVSMERDGNVNRSRFCAGCHDPVPFFSGRFNDPDFDDVHDPTAHAGITCSVCHSITHVNSVRGNADYTIDAPVHYPFAFDESRTLRWVNRQLIKSKPAFHKKTFLKPLHGSAEFCGSCHKVHLPQALNDYKWLRGQNHYDAWALSGVSGRGVSSFYYPPVAQQDCNGCHMPLVASDDFGAKRNDDSGALTVHDHLFPSANTAIPHLVGLPDADEVVEAHRRFNEGVFRVDLFGLRRGGTLDDELIAPLRPQLPALRRGETVLLDAVIRTLKMGHTFTQGTADSNEVWLDVTVSTDGRVVGRSGGRAADGTIDPWSHFVNAFVLDREGRRIDRRNAQDIFVALYNHQIPPGAADVIHYLLRVPPDAGETLTVDVALRYRKFDTTLMQHVYGDDYVNQLPELVLAEDSVTFPVAGGRTKGLAFAEAEPPPIELWQRWNDYGIGLLRKPASGELRQAEQAFRRVEQLGRPDGPLNLARVYLNEGRVTDDAPAALRRAAAFDPPAPAWTVLWFSGLVNAQNARFDEAIRDFEQIVEGGFEQAIGRGFDFSKDYRLLNRLGQTLHQRAKQERGERRRARRLEFLGRAERRFLEALELDPENATAHYNLNLVYTDRAEPGDGERAAHHAAEHDRYRVDDNARDHAIAEARRRYPAADHAAEAVVIYDLQRPGAFELGEPVSGPARASTARARKERGS